MIKYAVLRPKSGESFYENKDTLKALGAVFVPSRKVWVYDATLGLDDVSDAAYCIGKFDSDASILDQDEMRKGIDRCADLKETLI